MADDPKRSYHHDGKWHPSKEGLPRVGLFEQLLERLRAAWAVLRGHGVLYNVKLTHTGLLNIDPSEGVRHLVIMGRCDL